MNEISVLLWPSNFGDMVADTLSSGGFPELAREARRDLGGEDWKVTVNRNTVPPRVETNETFFGRGEASFFANSPRSSTRMNLMEFSRCLGEPSMSEPFLSVLPALNSFEPSICMDKDLMQHESPTRIDAKDHNALHTPSHVTNGRRKTRDQKLRFKPPSINEYNQQN